MSRQILICHTTASASRSSRRPEARRNVAGIAMIVWAISAMSIVGAADESPAQSSRNVNLLSMFQPEGSTTSLFPSFIYNDLWGHTTAAGGEYIVMGSRQGTYIVDATNPSQLTSIAYFAASAGNTGWGASWWRDMKSFGNYAYVVTEGGGGMQIIDLTNPNTPQMVGSWGRTLWRNTHNIAMDMGTGIAYCCGSRNGLHAIDVKTNPTSPTRLSTFQSPYVHDLHVQNGFAYLADQNNNRLLIVDVSALPNFTTLGRGALPGTQISHTAWGSADDAYCVTTNEHAGGPVGIFDVRNKANPQLVATYRAGPTTAIPHNAYMRDGILHVSYYTEGYRAVDLSNPASPVEVAYYDTWPGTSSGFNGAWACYCYAPSGVVYVNDMQAGLHVLKPRCTATRYGAATPGTNGKAPVIRHWGAAYIGNASFQLRIDKAPASVAGYMVVGFAKDNANVGGLQLNVQLFSPQAAIIPVSTDANGRASLPIAIPAIASLDGTRIYTQCFAIDANAPLGLAASRGMEFELFQK